MGFTNLNFKKSKVRMQFYQNPRFRDKILTIQSLKIPCDPYKIHTQSSFHTFLAFLSSSLLFFFSSSSSSSLLLPFVFELSSKMETNFGLLIKNLLGLVWLSQKPIFGLSFFICFLILHLSRNYTTIPIISSLAHSLFKL